MAVRLIMRRNGGPEVIEIETVDLPAPGPGEVRLRQSAVGLNFKDIYGRRGMLNLPLPSGLGFQAAGRVEAVGPGVDRVKPGDRVAYGDGALGAYATERNMPQEPLIVLPPGVSEEDAAAGLIHGMTAECLLRQVYRVQAGETILFHAAAGGAGLMACQWAKALGATVIGTVSTNAKAALARANGCDHVIVTGEEDFVARVREITDGKGVPVVYDGVGKDTFTGSLDCLAMRGMLVSFGSASGIAPPLDVTLLNKGSYYLTRPSLSHYTQTREELEACAEALFDVLKSGKVKVTVGQRFALRDAAKAHRAMEDRATVGSTVLVP